VWNDDARCTCIERGGERQLVMLGHTHYDQSAAFRVGLRRVDSTSLISFDNQHWPDPGLLVQFEPVEHAMLNIYPDEVGLCGCEKLSHKCARDTVSDTEQCLCWVCLSVLQSFLQISRICEHSRTVGCLSMQVRLLAVGLEFGHCGEKCLDVAVAGGAMYC
jgi:hypothetical protein